MLRIKGKSVKEQLADMKKNPELVLTTGRPLDLETPAQKPRGKHPGLRPKEVKDESAQTESKAKAGKA